MTMNKKAKLAEFQDAYRKGQAQHKVLTENLLRMEGGIALLTDLIAEEEKASQSASTETPNA